MQTVRAKGKVVEFIHSHSTTAPTSVHLRVVAGVVVAPILVIVFGESGLKGFMTQ